MSSATKQSMDVDRAEVVQRLRALADQLEQGTIFVEDQAFEVADAVHLEIEADRDELEIEIEWEASGAEEELGEEQDELEAAVPPAERGEPVSPLGQP